MTKRLGDFTMTEIRAECDRHIPDCYVCAFWEKIYGCMANPCREKYLGTEIEIADAEGEK